MQVTFIQSTLPGFFRGDLVHAAFEALVILGFDNVGHSCEEAVTNPSESECLLPG